MNNNFELIENIPYGTHERQKFDIFIPEKIKCKHGLILFIHGGGWTNGDKTVHHVDAKHFCSLGYICVSMNYRFVTNELDVFDELDDITAALSAIKQKCNEFGCDLSKLILSGGSAGGHLSLLYAYTRMDEAPIKPVAACVYCPPVKCWENDFLIGLTGEFESWKYEVLSSCCSVNVNKDTLNNKEQQDALKKISPQVYVNNDCVPTAVFQGVNDELVPFRQVQEFVDELNEIGITNKMLIYPNSGHALDKDPDCSEKAREIIKEYCEKYF